MMMRGSMQFVLEWRVSVIDLRVGAIESEPAPL